MIKLTGVSLARNKRVILEDLNWEVKKGEHWAVLGGNGAGKTMLLKMLSGYLWPSKGEIFVLGKKFGEVDLSALRQTIGWVSFDLQKVVGEVSACEVVLSGYFASIGLYKKPTEQILKRADKLLKFVGLKEHKDNLFSHLSYGEQKKILIARSLISKPKLLLLDEPCSGLDMKAREEFLLFVDKVAKQKNGPTIILVTHHLEEIIPGMTHVLALKQGQIVGKGEKREILTEALIKKVFA
ncbi:ABC transporter ATP-binding protein [Candidatus Daviesbacteria bacterium]|nr:ABC transporter ATP-binding protein [Candidatus Daviesbacteria bacterium]